MSGVAAMLWGHTSCPRDAVNVRGRDTGEVAPMQDKRTPGDDVPARTPVGGLL